MTEYADASERAAAAPAAAVPGGPRDRRGRRLTRPAIALAAIVVPVLAACGSASGQPSAAAVSKTCTVVSATLSDGPDPGADPVGYAEAQILPLRQIHAADPALRTAIDDLASAYARVFGTDGKSAAATLAVTTASKKVNAICPGAAA